MSLAKKKLKNQKRLLKNSVFIKLHWTQCSFIILDLSVYFWYSVFCVDTHDGGYGVAASTRVCGTLSLGSIPSSHPLKYNSLIGEFLVYLSYMKNTIIIHGTPSKQEFFDPHIPSPSNQHWFPWLQKQLALRDEISVAPEMPQPYEPRYDKYVSVIENYHIDHETVLIGHSCGAGFLLRYLSENPELEPAKVMLVAPWLDPDNWLPTVSINNDFFDFEIDTTLSDRTELHILYSTDDEEYINKSVVMIRTSLPNAHYHEFTDKDHFCTPELPELLKLL